VLHRIGRCLASGEDQVLAFVVGQFSVVEEGAKPTAQPQDGALHGPEMPLTAPLVRRRHRTCCSAGFVRPATRTSGGHRRLGRCSSLSSRSGAALLLLHVAATHSAAVRRLAKASPRAPSTSSRSRLRADGVDAGRAVTRTSRSARRTISSNVSFLRRGRVMSEIQRRAVVERGAAAGGRDSGNTGRRVRARPRRPDLNGPLLIQGCAAEHDPRQRVSPSVATARELRRASRSHAAHQQRSFLPDCSGQRRGTQQRG